MSIKMNPKRQEDGSMEINHYDINDSCQRNNGTAGHHVGVNSLGAHYIVDTRAMEEMQRLQRTPFVLPLGNVYRLVGYDHESRTATVKPVISAREAATAMTDFYLTNRQRQ
jgi:hypothetical protein